MKSYKTIKNQLLKDKQVQKEYDLFEPEFEVIRAIVEKRIQEGITQSELAKRIGTKQSAISRFEKGSYNPSLAFLQRVAKALDARLKVTIS